MKSNHPAKSWQQTFQAFAASGARALIFVFGLQGSILVAEQNPEASIHAVLDGLHESAAASEMDRYFSHYTNDAVFLGTDASERWTMAAFKSYAAPAFAEGRGWTYEVQSRHLIKSDAPGVYGFDEILLNEKLGLCRGSGMVVKAGDRWQISHYVLSMLIPNQIAADVGERSKALME
ncbi:MAG: nuclear transport factor 2 family protein [Pseudomonadales bacterium]